MGRLEHHRAGALCALAATSVALALLLAGCIHHGAAQPVVPVAEAPTETRLGTSRGGRPIDLLRFGPLPATNATLVILGCHGNERGALAVGQRLVAALQADAGWLPPGATLYVVPCLNPDGAAAGTRVNAAKVDINRNFPVHWEAKAAAPRYNPGPAPFSEPESQAAKAALEASGARKVLCLHEPLAKLICSGPRSRDMAELLAEPLGLPIASDSGYPTPGAFGEYCAAAYGASDVTIELRAGQAGEAAWQGFRSGLLRVAAMAIEPAAAGEPRPAEGQ
jgi:protein MpaA